MSHSESECIGLFTGGPLWRSCVSLGVHRTFPIFLYQTLHLSLSLSLSLSLAFSLFLSLSLTLLIHTHMSVYIHIYIYIDLFIRLNGWSYVFMYTCTHTCVIHLHRPGEQQVSVRKISVGKLCVASSPSWCICWALAQSGGTLLMPEKPGAPCSPQPVLFIDLKHELFAP